MMVGAMIERQKKKLVAMCTEVVDESFTPTKRRELACTALDYAICSCWKKRPSLQISISWRHVRKNPIGRPVMEMNNCREKKVFCKNM
ncbi:hypothetical protein Tco_0323335, partial [Tanacetum coccineum]